MNAPAPYTFAEPFPVMRYRLHGVVTRRLAFPDFAGSALRGAFGHALKSAVCATGLPQCASCPLYRSCAYPMLFEPPSAPGGHHQRAPVPWVIEPPAPGLLLREPGAAFDFDLVLIGPALDHAGIIFDAWRLALAQRLGTGAVELLRISAEAGATVLAGEAPRLRAHAAALTIPAATGSPRQAALRFSTPLQFTRNGKPLASADLSARDLLMGLVRRVADIVEGQLQRPLQVDFAALAQRTGAVTVRGQWQARQWQRYSSRQRRAMPMGGAVGTCVLQGDLAPFQPFLYLGQWLHVGKKSSFGMGRYTLEPAA